MSEAATAPQIGDDLGDDIVLPFRTERSGVIGRAGAAGPAIDTILSRHDMPVPVAQALGEAVALTTMLGSSVEVRRQADRADQDRWRARFPRRQFRGAAAACAAMRDIARSALPRSSRRRRRGDQGKLLGAGHLAITIDQGGEMDRYQGIVALDGE